MRMKEAITPETVLTRTLVQRRLYMQEFLDVPKEIHLGSFQDAVARFTKYYDEAAGTFYDMKVVLMPTDNFIEVR
jgi:hypothetical protein